MEGEIKCIYTSYNNERFFLRNKQISYQNIMREFRSILCRDLYYDIDIENCHPVLLYQYCIKNNIKCKYLKKYIDDRQTILSQINEDKDIGKKSILKILNGGKINNEEKKDKYLIKLYDEVKDTIHPGISKINTDIMDYINKGHYDDEDEPEQIKKRYSTPEGRCCSHLLQKLENTILMSSVNYFRKNGYSIGALLFDGLMIQKTKDINHFTLNSLKEYVKKDTEYDVNFVIKPMDHTYNIDTRDEEEIKYNEIKEEIEKTYFIIKEPFGFGNIDTEGNLHIKKESHIKIVLADKNYTIEKNGRQKTINFYEKWIQDKDRKLYENIVFDTQKNNPLSYNLFTGFKYDTYQKKKEVDVSFIYKVLQNLLITKEVYDHVLDFISYIIQYKKKTGVALLLFSHTHGIGKDTIMILITKLLGHKYCNKLNNFNDLDKEFNGMIENKLFVYSSEIKAKTQDLYDKLKDRITQTSVSINKKGINPYTIEDITSYAFTTNTYNPIKIEQSDRRLSMIELKEERMSSEISNKFYSMMEDDDVLKTIFDDLKSRKVDKNFKCIETEYKKDIQEIYENSCVKYLYKNFMSYKGGKISVTDLFDEVKKYEKENNYYDISSSKHLSKLLKQKLNITSVKSSKDNGKYMYYFNDDMIEKLRIYDSKLFEEYIV